jgi:hypothetical protein
MRNAIAAAALFTLLWFAETPAAGQSKPDFSGIWQLVNTAAWDLQDHSGALGVPPGQGVVEGGEIPYRTSTVKSGKSAIQHDQERRRMPESTCGC